MDERYLKVKVRFDDEPGYIVVGLIDDKYWTAAITYRAETERIISVRRSRRSGVALYES